MIAVKDCVPTRFTFLSHTCMAGAIFCFQPKRTDALGAHGKMVAIGVCHIDL